MSRPSADRGPGWRRLLAACAGILLVAVGAYLLARSDYLEVGNEYEDDEPDPASAEPARIEPIEGTSIKRVMFSEDAAKRVGLQTAAVREDGESKTIPHAAILYDAGGKAFAYTSPEPLVFVREAVEVDRVEGDVVVLADGPPAGTAIVTVGAAEVYGTEFEVAN